MTPAIGPERAASVPARRADAAAPGIVKRDELVRGGILVRAFQLQSVRADDPHGANRATEFERGVAEGERRYREHDGARAARQHALLAGVIRQLEDTVASFYAAAEAQVVELALEIARKIVRELAEEKRELIVTMAREAVTRAKDRGRLQGPVLVRVHPDDAPILEDAKGRLAEEVEGAALLTVLPDPAITRGGCRVETSVRLVDATLEMQLARLGAALHGRNSRDPT